MLAYESVTRLTCESVDGLTRTPLPVLIGCLYDDRGFSPHLASLEVIAMFFQGEIKVCYALEEMSPYFQMKFGITGTPAYILTQSGRVLGTVLGRVATSRLVEQISEMLMSQRRQALRTITLANIPQREQ